MKLISQVLAILLLALIPACLTAAFHPRRPAWSERTLSSGEEKLQTVLAWGKTVLWVDARAAKDYQTDHIPEAISLNLEDWDVSFPNFLDQWRPEKKVVVYCSSTSCQLSHEVAERLRQSGISPVYVLKGGWEAWKAGR